MTNAIGSAVLGLGGGWLAAIPPGSGAVAALGWTLLHFCWQGAGVALALWCGLGLVPARWTRARYGAACLALALMVALPVETFARLAAEARPVAPEVPLLRMEAVAGPESSGPTVQQPLRERIAEALDAAAPWVPAIWLVGVVLFLGRLKLGLAAARRMRVAGTQAAPKELQSLLRQLAARLQVARAVQLMHTAVVQVPTVIGWLRPVILLPIGCFSGLSQTQIEALLAHELAHIRRHDYMVSVFQSVVEALLFYHPAVWWVSRQVRQERECCCDELAVGVAGDRLAYARALSFLEERRAGSQEMVLGANGGVLTMRIRRLLGLKADTVASQAAAWTLLAVVIAVAGSYVVTAARAEAKATQASAPEAAPLVNSIHATAPVGAGVEASSAKPKASRLAELDRNVQNGKETVAFLEGQLRIEKVDDDGQPSDEKRLEEHLLQSKIDQARQLFQQDYRELVAAGNSEPRPAQVAAANSSDDLRTARGIYKTWLDEDVRWIITDAERAAFLQLANDEERDTFIAQFWARRDLPGTAANTFREQHYARIAYSNQHFATAAVPGWKSDRGHIYIVYGKPDSIDAHPSGGQYQRPGGQSTTSAYPFEVWHYRSVPGIGEEVDIDFVDTCRCGEYHYTIDRAENDLLAPDRAARAAKVLAPPTIVRTASFRPAGGATQTVNAVQREAALSGRVTDVSGGPVRGATLTAVNTDNGGFVRQVSDDSGAYSFQFLPLGNYNIEVAADGFLRQLQENVRVEAGKSVGLNPTLRAAGTGKTPPMPAQPGMVQWLMPGVVEKQSAPAQTSNDVPDQALLQNGLLAIQQGQYEVGRMRLQTLINTYPDSQLVKRAHLAIAASWEKQGGNAAKAEADKEYAEAGLTPKKITPGDGITPPMLIYQVDPKVFSAEAKKAKTTGTVIVSLWVDAQGNPTHVKVARGLGSAEGIAAVTIGWGPDGRPVPVYVKSATGEINDKAVEAVKQYRFKPAMQNGKPVVVELNIEVNFQSLDKPN